MIPHAARFAASQLGPPRRVASAVPLLLILTLAACQKATDSADQPDAAGGDTSVAGASGSGVTTGAGGDTTGSTTTAASEPACAPPSPTAASSGWAYYVAPEGDYAFNHPTGWENLSGQLRMTGAFPPATAAEAGKQPDAPISPVLLRDPSGDPNITVFRLLGVKSAVDTLYARQEAHFRALPQKIDVVGAGRRFCINGSPALGMAFQFDQDVLDLQTGEEKEQAQRAYQESWIVVHDGALYEIQFLGDDQAAAPTFEEILRTWRWTTGPVPGATPVGTGGAESDTATTGMETARGDTAAAGGERASLAETALTASIDASAQGPDPSTYATTFPVSTPAVYVVYKLREGPAAHVKFLWKKDGEVLLTAGGDQLIPGDRWAYQALTPPSTGFLPGNYEVELQVEGGEQRSLPFTIE